VGRGFSEDVAFGLSRTMRAAFCIIASELDGRKFNWSSMSFEEIDA
jgi:hypothetical protein